jgi:hypothetical protein
MSLQVEDVELRPLEDALQVELDEQQGPGVSWIYLMFNGN